MPVYLQILASIFFLSEISYSFLYILGKKRSDKLNENENNKKFEEIHAILKQESEKILEHDRMLVSHNFQFDSIPSSNPPPSKL